MMGLHTEFSHLQAFYRSVVVATPQAYFGYEEQAPFVMHPAPVVVQVPIAELQSVSVVNVTGSKSQIKFIHVYVTPFHPHVGLSYPVSGLLLHSYGVIRKPQDEGLVLHYQAKSQPKVDLES